MQQATPYQATHADQLLHRANKAIPELQVVRHGRPWCRTAVHHMISAGLGTLCAQGLMSCGILGDGTPIHWQLIRGAAVSAPQVSRLGMPCSMHVGPLPQVAAMNGTTRGCVHVLASCTFLRTEISDCRTLKPVLDSAC